MTSFLFIVSFLLHIIAIYTIIQLYWKVQSLKNTDSDEISELLESYLQEIKEENNRLQKGLHEKASNNQKEKELLQVTESDVHDVTEENKKEESPLYENAVPDFVEASLESKVLQLHAGGFSITDIAKKLNCGKTEAELIINLNEKNKF